MSKNLLNLHKYLRNYFGPLRWWPGDSELEIMVGAILTQNTNWQNVSKAICNLKAKKLLDVKPLYYIKEQSLSELIKPCGYHNLKAKRLKNFISFFYKEYAGSPEKMFSDELYNLREKLLNINGVGPETADSILLYAGGKPIFVVDAYTSRIFQRHQYFSTEYKYRQIQDYFMDKLPRDSLIYNEFHAQIVMIGKKYCKKNNPECEDCPLFSFFEKTSLFHLQAEQYHKNKMVRS